MMKKKIAIAVLSLITAFSGVVPAHAFPSISPPKVEAPNGVEKIQWRGGGALDSGEVYRPRGWRGDRGWRGGPRYYGRDRYYGHRHYRHRRGPSAGAIIGGLAAGAIIGGALAQPRYVERRYVAPRRYVGGNSHVNWCYQRYRSYRAYDNTFQPYNGPRQQCYSPY
jgi:hypothetical protein